MPEDSGCFCCLNCPISSPSPSWFEQNPEDWWTATVNCIREMFHANRINPSEIKGIGLSGMYHGLVLLDGSYNVIRPCILWNDQRTADQSEYILQKVGEEKLSKIAATSCAPYFTACKLMWVRDNEPEKNTIDILSFFNLFIHCLSRVMKNFPCYNRG